MEVLGLRDKNLKIFRRTSVRLFLECRIYDSQLVLQLFHQSLDKFRGTITRNNILLLYTEAFSGKQRVHEHA